MKGSIDIFIRSENKLDETVSKKQFEIQGYKTFREDRNKHGAGVMLYLNENILCRVLDIGSNFNDLETIFLEFFLRNKTWLCLGLYKPPNQNDPCCPDKINKSPTKLSSHFGNIMFLGDFNRTAAKRNLDTFMSCFDLEGPVKAQTCDQFTNPKYIDLISTNKKNFVVLEVKICNHHKIVLTALKSQFTKGSPVMTFYRGYKSFDIDTFKTVLPTVLSVSKIKNYSIFHWTFTSVLL